MSLSKYDYWIKGDEMIEKSLRENMKIEMYQVPDFQYEMIVEMLKVLYVYEVENSPSKREFDCTQIQSLIESLEEKLESQVDDTERCRCGKFLKDCDC